MTISRAVKPYIARGRCGICNFDRTYQCHRWFIGMQALNASDSKNSTLELYLGNSVFPSFTTCRKKVRGLLDSDGSSSSGHTTCYCCHVKYRCHYYCYFV
jgi:hypothetical protein